MELLNAFLASPGKSKTEFLSFLFLDSLYISPLDSSKIKKLFFEWNNLSSSVEKRQSLFENLAKSVNVENLILRCNSLRGDITAVISSSLSASIKFLDLYDNQITNEGMLLHNSNTLSPFFLSLYLLSLLLLLFSKP